VSLERDVPADQIGEYIRAAGNLVWVDIEDPGPAELSMLLEEFGFHPLALEDVAKGQQRPKVDEYKSYIFVVAYGVVPGDDAASVRPIEVDLFVGRNYLVSVHRGRLPALEEAYSRWTRGGAMLREGVGFLIYTVMDAIIDAYFPIIDAIEDDLDEAEEEVFSASRRDNLQDLLRLKRTLFQLRRAVYPLRETFNVFLRRDHPMFSGNAAVYFRDVYDHILRILDVLEIQRDVATGVLDAYLTVISNRLNVTMKTLTVVAVTVGIAGCVFGAWGMNVGGIPFGSAAGGFLAVCGMTAGLIVAILLFSRKRGWL